MNLANISPAPWFARGEGICCGVYQGTPEQPGYAIDLDDPAWADAEFIALARNAFDVMLRRGWHPCQYAGSSWGVQDRFGGCPHGLLGWPAACHDDPFTPLVEADQWYRENREKKKE